MTGLLDVWHLLSSTRTPTLPSAMNEFTLPDHDQSVHHAEYQTAAPNVGHTSVLANANNVRIKDSSFSVITNVNIESRPALEALYQRVAPNAILNEGGRADDVKCHPGMREEVIDLIENWATAAEGDRLMWLTGPAGGGKTAIMKTIAERSKHQGSHPTINFFFFRGDLTRNNARPVVLTLIYQLFQIYPDFADDVAKKFLTHPRVLDTSIAEQCGLISMLSSIIRQLPPTYARIILLIDGLDECDVDAERSQGNILRALESLVVEDNSPFRLLVASRPEARIQMTFNQISHAQTIFLDDQYRPENDIRTFVTAEFDRIKASHPRASLLPCDWPSPSDIEGIVARSSWQFIYAATVMRYISHPSVVPSLSLERVQGISPVVSNSPFAYLDSVYTFILARADDQDTMRDILSMQLLQIGTPGAMDILGYYNSQYNQVLIQSCISDLSSIIQLTRNGNLRLYHASLADFLIEKKRSGIYWVDVDTFRAKVLVATWTKPPIETNSPYINLQVQLFRKLESSSPDLTHLLLNMPVPDWMLRDIGQTPYIVCLIIQKLYYESDIETYKHILRRLTQIMGSLDIRLHDPSIPFFNDYMRPYRKDSNKQNRHAWLRCFRRK